LKRDTTGIFESEFKSDEPSVQKIGRLFAKHFKSFAEMPSLASVVFSEEIFRNEKKLICKISEVIEHNNQTLLSILKEGQQRDQIRTDIDASHLAIFIMGALRLFVKKWQFSGFTFNIEKEGDKLTESVKRLISAQ
jgi:hypothetical protein